MIHLWNMTMCKYSPKGKCLIWIWFRNLDLVVSLWNFINCFVHSNFSCNELAFSSRITTWKQPWMSVYLEFFRLPSSTILHQDFPQALEIWLSASYQKLYNNALHSTNYRPQIFTHQLQNWEIGSNLKIS